MKTQYDYIHFEQVPAPGKTTRWECRNLRSGGVLGMVKWYGAWRQYCYFPSECAVYSAGCLRDVANFIVELKASEAKSRGGSKGEGYQDGH